MHVSIDPDSHLDLKEIGMELCCEALEETVTSEESQHLFEMETCKFQKVETLAFFKLTFFPTTQAPPPIF